MNDLSTIKKELINLQNSINSSELAKYDWIVDFSIVKFVSLWEGIIRIFTKKELKKIDNIENFAIKIDHDRFCRTVWHDWCKNPSSMKFPIKAISIKPFRKDRNIIAHGHKLENKETVKNITDAIKKTLNTLEDIESSY